VRRRDFITSIVVAAALWPALLRAQSAKPAPRIGVLAQFSAASRFSVEFREAMRDLGYVEGQNSPSNLLRRPAGRIGCRASPRNSSS
jgi:hypothetical protein